MSGILRARNIEMKIGKEKDRDDKRERERERENES